MITRLLITPQTHVRTTQDTKLVFRIPEECPHNCGRHRKKNKEDLEGCPHMLNVDNYRFKKRIERYNEYKFNLLALAKEKAFQMPYSGSALRFYIPIAKRVRSRKQRAAMHFSVHDMKPDVDNLLKAFLDALFPGKDQRVGHFSELGKYWVDSDTGWIEIETGMPTRQELEAEIRRLSSLTHTEGEGE